MRIIEIHPPSKSDTYVVFEAAQKLHFARGIYIIYSSLTLQLIDLLFANQLFQFTLSVSRMTSCKAHERQKKHNA